MTDSGNGTWLERLDRWLNPGGLAPYGVWMETPCGGSFWVSGIDKERLPAIIAAVVELERTEPIDGPIVAGMEDDVG